MNVTKHMENFFSVESLSLSNNAWSSLKICFVIIHIFTPVRLISLISIYKPTSPWPHILALLTDISLHDSPTAKQFIEGQGLYLTSKEIHSLGYSFIESTEIH